MTKHLLGTALAFSLAAHGQSAGAQSSTSTRSRAFVLNAGPMIGVLGTGFYGRINPEIQLHREARYGGHALGLGLAVVLWP